MKIVFNGKDDLSFETKQLKQDLEFCGYDDEHIKIIFMALFSLAEKLQRDRVKN